MARKSKQVKQTKNFFKQRLTKINEVVGLFESEVEKVLDKLMERGEKSGKVIRKNIDEILGKVSSSNFYSLASEKTEEITKDLKRIGEDLITQFKKIDMSRANNMVEEARANLDQLVGKVQALELVEKAKDRAIDTKNQVLNVLHIPTQKDINQLSRKVVTIEKKIKALNHKRGAKKAA